MNENDPRLTLWMVVRTSLVMVLIYGAVMVLWFTL